MTKEGFTNIGTLDQSCKSSTADQPKKELILTDRTAKLDGGCGESENSPVLTQSGLIAAQRELVTNAFKE